MAKKRVSQRDRIMAELGWPYLFWVSREQWLALTGYDPEDACAVNDDVHPISYIKQSLRGKAKLNTIYHEILDKVCPSWEHWRIALAAQVLARGGHRGEETEGVDNHEVSEIQPRPLLIQIVRRAVARYNKKVMPRGKRKKVRSR